VTRSLIVLLSLLLSGCASTHGFDRATMQSLLHPDNETVTEQTASSQTDKPARPLPLRMAIYFVQRSFPLHHQIQRAEWVAADKDLLTKWLMPLQSEQILTETFHLVDTTIQGHDVEKIRRAAARYGADVVLIVDGLASVDRYNNGYAAWYATLIGAYVAPGTVSDALVMIRSSLWDARTERLYMTQMVEGRSTLTGSALLLEDGPVLAQAKTAALVELGKRTVDEWRRSRTLPARDRSR
jgi:rhombotail lipoprotein